jgi:hypothetical protein
MGWWSDPENPEVIIGDAVLDGIRHFLVDFSREYQKDLSRKPTLKELEYALNLACRVNLDDDLLADFEETEVKQVIIKTAKRKKRQKVSPGDIFAYRLDDGTFGFGRIVSNVSIGSVAEIFDYFSKSPVLDRSKEHKWLIPPVPIESYGLLEDGSIGDWRVIDHQPGFIPDDKFSSLRYVYGSSPSALVATDIYENERPIGAAEAKGLPEYYAYDDFNFKELIGRALAKNRT